MSMLKRVRDITMASLNDRLERCEDPVKAIDQHLYDLAEQIRQLESLRRQCASHAESMLRQYSEAGQLKLKRKQQAVLALKAGEEELAKLALKEKLQAEEREERYKALYDDSAGSLSDVQERLEQLQADYREVAGKRSYYAARLESARLQKRVSEQAGAGRGGLSGAFDRLEERVSYMEAESRALRDLRSMNAEAVYGAGSLLSQALEAEFEKLRKKQEGENKSQ